MSFFFFFFTAPPTTHIYTLSLHDALPISPRATVVEGAREADRRPRGRVLRAADRRAGSRDGDRRSEEHTSELQSHSDLVCRLLLEKKKKKQKCKHNVNNKNSKDKVTVDK